MARINFNDRKLLRIKQQLLPWLDFAYLYGRLPSLRNKISFKRFKKDKGIF